MQIICHRGLWTTAEEKNTRPAFERAFRAGFGVETDVRDCLGKLVIAHDPPRGDEMPLREFLEMHAALGHPGVLALNIKADGLRKALDEEAEPFPEAQIFVFDMSTPDLRSYVGGPFHVFTRQSEFEAECVLYTDCHGVWLDAFQSDWYSTSLVRDHLTNGKKVCVVSPELHGRPPDTLWAEIQRDALHGEAAVYMCTDLAPRLCRFFGLPGTAQN